MAGDEVNECIIRRRKPSAVDRSEVFVLGIFVWVMHPPFSMTRCGWRPGTKMRSLECSTMGWMWVTDFRATTASRCIQYSNESSR